MAATDDDHIKRTRKQHCSTHRGTDYRRKPSILGARQKLTIR
jgi:hypothetical protein